MGGFFGGSTVMVSYAGWLWRRGDFVANVPLLLEGFLGGPIVTGLWAGWILYVVYVVVVQLLAVGRDILADDSSC